MRLGKTIEVSGELMRDIFLPLQQHNNPKALECERLISASSEPCAMGLAGMMLWVSRSSGHKLLLRAPTVNTTLTDVCHLTHGRSALTFCAKLCAGCASSERKSSHSICWTCPALVGVACWLFVALE